MVRKLLGDEHSDVATSLNKLARLRLATGDYAAAEPIFREELAMEPITTQPASVASP